MQSTPKRLLVVDSEEAFIRHDIGFRGEEMIERPTAASAKRILRIKDDPTNAQVLESAILHMHTNKCTIHTDG